MLDNRYFIQNEISQGWFDEDRENLRILVRKMMADCIMGN
jgi:hypothetical protein